MLRLILLLIFIIDIIFSIIAYLVGPNLIFGIRIGFTMLDKRVWRKTHRLLIILLILSTIIFYLISAFIENIITLIFVFSTLLIVPRMIAVIKSIEYAEIITGFYNTKGEKFTEIPPFNAGKSVEIGVGVNIIFAIIIVLSLIMLPDMVAIRFDLSGNPVAWQEKTQYLALITLIEILLFLSEIIVVKLGEKYPIAFYAFTIKDLGRDALFRFLIYSLLVGQVIIVFAATIILLYAIISIPPGIILMIVVFSLALIPLILVYFKRNQKE